MSAKFLGDRGKHSKVGAEQVKALMDDLDNSMSSLDERLRAIAPASPAPSGNRRVTDLPFPTIDLSAHREFSDRPQRDAGPAAQSTGWDATASDLLAELARSAEEHTQDKLVQSRSQQEREARLDAVLRGVFDYLHQFTRHVNVIKPAIPLHYVLDLQHRFGALQWSEGFADFRTRSKSEAALIETVSVRLRYATEALHILRSADQVKALRDELHLLNLTITDESNASLPGKGNGVRFTIAGSIPVQLNFRCDLPTGRIIVRGRNIGTLGLSAYLIDPDKLARTTLDAVGLNLLGRSTRLPREFVPVAFSTRV